MGILNSPTNLLIIGGLLAVVYSYGRYSRHPWGEYGKHIGLLGVGLVMLKLFWSFCPAVAVSYLLPLAAIAIVSQLVFWAVHKLGGSAKSGAQFSFDRDRPGRQGNSAEM